MPREVKKATSYQITFNAEKHLGNMLRKALDDDTFTGRTAASDRAVAVAYIRWALAQGAYTVHPGVRNIAQFAGVGRTTVTAAGERLNKLGWLRIVWKSSAFDSNAQQVRLMWNSEQFLEYIPPAQPDVFLLNQVDIWGGDGLGFNARTIFQVLYKNPSGKRLHELKTLTNLSEKQIRTALSKLLTANLIRKNGLTYINICPEGEHSQRNLALAIRLTWMIDDKEAAREQRFAREREYRKRQFDSPEYKKYKSLKYRKT